MTAAVLAALIVAQMPTPAPSPAPFVPSCREMQAGIMRNGVTKQAFGAPLLLSGIGSTLSGAILLGMNDEGATAAATGTMLVGAAITVAGIALLASGRASVEMAMTDCAPGT